MKRVWIFIILFALLLGVFACGNTEEPSAKKITVNYYVGDTLADSKEYTDEIELWDYEKEDAAFLGWYFDEELTLSYEASDVSWEKTELALYAKIDATKKEEEVEMKDFGITIKGKINDDEFVRNPSFTWSANEGDASYKVMLYLGDKLVEGEKVSGTSYRVKKALKKDSDYKFVVKGQDTNEQSAVRFHTVVDCNDSIGALAMDNPFSSKMVLQRNVDVTLSGTAPAGELLDITVGEDKYEVISTPDGRFSLTLAAREASFDPISIVVDNGLDRNKPITISDILFGDVYLFAGQSNMQRFALGQSDCTEEDLNKVKEADVRFFTQTVTTSESKLDHVVGGKWSHAADINYEWFSAIATMTASILATDVKDETPIGIITAYQGDTNIKSWVEASYVPSAATKSHYNAMIYPLKAADIRGVVWYQGCNNSAAGCEYKEHLAGLFRNYRALFHNADLAFFVVGLACFDGDKDGNGNLDPMKNPYDFSFVRESQLAACNADDNAYFISSCDDGDKNDIHPMHKRYICERLAKSIGAVFYGKECYKEGPSYEKMTVNGGEVTVTLKNADGLYTTGDITGFFLAGEDGRYYEATARLEGNAIVASSEKVADPKYAKYGFERSPFVNIFNKDDFAIAPFRTDDYGEGIDWFVYDSAESYVPHSSGAAMTADVTESGLYITKGADQTYGSLRLYKWGAIGYKPKAFECTLIGTGDNAVITIRITEGSNETWGYTIRNDFVGKQTFTVGIDAFTVKYGKNDGILDTQKVMLVEIMVEASHEGKDDNGNAYQIGDAAAFTLCEARFVKAE